MHRSACSLPLSLSGRSPSCPAGTPVVECRAAVELQAEHERKATRAGATDLRTLVWRTCERHSSISGRRRRRLTSARRRLASRRRRIEAPDGLVARRTLGGVERRSSSARILRRQAWRFWSCERSARLVTTIPVGMWRMRTAELAVLTPWPPGPDAWKASALHWPASVSRSRRA